MQRDAAQPGYGSHRLHRRRLLALAAPLALGLALPVRPAGAGVGWCRVDPSVRLNGTIVNFWISIREEDLPFVDGPVDCRVLTERGVLQELLFLDFGFNGYGEEIRFESMVHETATPGEPFKTSVKVVVPHTKRGAKFPIQLEIVPENGESVVETGNAGATDVSLSIVPRL